MMLLFGTSDAVAGIVQGARNTAPLVGDDRIITYFTAVVREEPLELQEHLDLLDRSSLPITKAELLTRSESMTTAPWYEYAIRLWIAPEFFVELIGGSPAPRMPYKTALQDYAKDVMTEVSLYRRDTCTEEWQIAYAISRPRYPRPLASTRASMATITDTMLRKLSWRIGDLVEVVLPNVDARKVKVKTLGGIINDRRTTRMITDNVLRMEATRDTVIDERTPAERLSADECKLFALDGRRRLEWGFSVGVHFTCRRVVWGYAMHHGHFMLQTLLAVEED